MRYPLGSKGALLTDLGVSIATPLSGRPARRRRPTRSCLYGIRTKIESNAVDVAMLAVADSTSDQTTEWVYMFGQWLAAKYPTHTVRYNLFDFPTSVYLAPITISTGSGPHTINLWNSSIGSSQPSQIVGDRFANAVGAINPDLLIVSHGHNMGSGDADTHTMDCEYVCILENVLLAHPGIAVAFFLQNPNRDSDVQAGRIAAVRALAVDRPEITLLDAYDRFLAAGKLSSLYIDSMHPTLPGQQLYVDALTSAWTAATLDIELPPMQAWLSTPGVNLLTNGDFSTWAGGTGTAPAGWTWNGIGTITQDVSTVYGARPYSVRLDSTGAANSLAQTLNGAALTPLLGQNVSLAVLKRRTGVSASIGRSELRKFGGAQVASSTFDHGSTLAGGAVGGWFWDVVRKYTVGPDATSLRIALNGNPSTLSTSSVWFDRAVLVLGNIPASM
jgi:hypothetical protein